MTQAQLSGREAVDVEKQMEQVQQKLNIAKKNVNEAIDEVSSVSAVGI